MALFSSSRTAKAVRVLVLAASLLLGACAASDTGKKDDPVFFGAGGATNGYGGANGGVSFSW
jgi:major membrane immunogen (membrane-anchored lipoprotein)